MDAICVTCGELKLVCCDSGYMTRQDGTVQHFDPFCVDCCPTTKDHVKDQIRRRWQKEEKRAQDRA